MQSMKRISTGLSGAWRLALAASLVWVPLAGASAHAQTSEQVSEPGAAVTAAPVIPQQVRYAGKLANRAGDTVEAVFSIYSSSDGGDPLWTETQKVSVDADGSYTVLLGSATQNGLPQTLFAGGAARWLGVTVERAQEQPRVLLSSVPYAMKSADAQALAGHPAGDFVTQEQLSQFAQNEAQRTATNEFQPLTSGAITGSGTTGNIAQFTGANTIGNSLITQTGSMIGINEASPVATLDVNGGGQFRGILMVPAKGVATTTASQPSQYLEFASSGWSTTTAGPVTPTFYFYNGVLGNNTANPEGEIQLGYQLGSSHNDVLSITGTGPLYAYGGFVAATTTLATTSSASNSPPVQMNAYAYSSKTSGQVSENFAWQVIPTGNDTTTPSANLNLLYGTGSTSPTGLSISSKGIINWATGQTFPGTGAGTITGITTTSPLTGSGTSGSVALGLNQTALVSDITPAMATSLESTYDSRYALLSANNSFQGNNDFFAPLETVFETETVSYSSTGPDYAAFLGFGTSGTIGSYGDSDTYMGMWGRSNSPAIGASGVMGSSSAAASNTYENLSNLAANEVAGVWGDTTGIPESTGGGTSGEYWAAGVLGTADQYNAGAFFNNSINGYYAVWAEALGSSGAVGGSAVSGDGVTGTSNTGDGVYGSSGSEYGVSGESSSGAGVYGYSVSSYGVEAESGSGNAVYGSTTDNGTAGTGLSAIWGVANSPTAGQAGVFGNIYATSGTYAYVSSLEFVGGMWADSADVNDSSGHLNSGLIATADDGDAGIFVNNSASETTLQVVNFGTDGTGLFTTLKAATPDGECGFGGGGTLTCTGQMKTLATSSDGTRKVETYATQSAESWMEDYGTGTMKMGVAVVKIDPAYADTISEMADYHVFLTPNADSKGLYVINKTLTSFEVRESGGGTSTLTFDYKIVGKRRGFEAQRLVDVTERFNQEHQGSLIARANGAPIPAAAAKRAIVSHRSSRPRGNGIGPNGLRAKVPPSLAPVRRAKVSGNRVSIDGPTTPSRR